MSNRPPAHPPNEPSVIVERAKQPKTLKIDRSQLPAAPPPPRLDDASPPAPPGAEQTIVTGPAQGRRVVIALFAAVLVVFAIFVAMKMWVTAEKKKAVAADPNAESLIDGHAPPPRTWTPSASSSVVAPAP
jgi:hypothetical protein